MNFTEKVNITGHLQIIKRAQTKWGPVEQTLFEDHNVIVGGMGRSIAQYMSTSGCTFGPCDPELETSSPYEKDDEKNKCAAWPYQLTHFQIGTGADSIPDHDASTITLLGAPLNREEYGGALNSADVEETDHMIYAEETQPLERQTVAKIGAQGILDNSGFVSVIVLDEETANNQILNEVGLLVNNPFIKRKDLAADGAVLGSQVAELLGGPGGTGPPSIPPQPSPEEEEGEWDPGNLLAAYRAFSPIHKKSYFTLVIRWRINFTIDCAPEFLFSMGGPDPCE